MIEKISSFRRPIRTRATAAKMLLALVGCGDGVSGSGGCPGLVTVTAGSGTTPEFGWSPSCEARMLVVEDPSVAQGQGRTWQFTGVFRPPIRYGVLPVGAGEIIPAEPLVVGTRYLVTVFREGETFPREVGSASFTP